jgi:unsaturated chondroitin disaccharide hydrolase
MIRYPALLLTLGLLAPFAAAAEKPLAVLADEQFAFAARQYAGLIDRMAAEKPNRQPRTFVNGKFQTTNLEGWTSGFFPGSLWFIYEHTKDAGIKAAAEKFTTRQEPIKNFTKHHDVGFMLFGSYGQGQRIEPRAAYRDVLIQGARSLATRYSPATGVIRSWDSPPWKFPVIIDNMMNLDLLWYAADEAKDESLRAIAISHANKTLANHFRPDGSSVHLVDYDPATGAVLKRQTVQGFADESAWARGQAWALYGFTTMYRLAGDKAYLEQACKTADFIASHPNLPADGIPYWDFNAPAIPDALRDVAAGAITSSALFELATFVDGERAARYRALAEKQLRTLCTAAFRAGEGENGHFLLMHGVGHLPAKSEVDVPLVYADYYFLEALGRAKR